MEEVFDHEGILEQLDRAQMLLTTRHLLTKHGPEDWNYWEVEQLPTQVFVGDVPVDLERHIQELMAWRMEAIPASARATSLRERHALLGVLVKKHQTLAQRFGQGVEHVERRVEYFSGFYHALEQGDEWQLGASKPWWKPSMDFVLDPDWIASANDQELREQGYEQIHPDVYLERARITLIAESLTLPAIPEIDWAAHVIVLCTRSIRDIRKWGMSRLVQRTRSELIQRCQQSLAQQHALIPMKPLFSLPRESNNISTFLFSRPNKLELKGETVIEGPLDSAIVQIARREPGRTSNTNDEQLELVFGDRVMLAGSDGRTVMTLTIESTQTDPIALLTSAAEQLDIHRGMLEHLPRVCAGMFTAAKRDRSLGFDHDGAFWDTESGTRLCRICGLNDSNWRHRNIVQQIRQLLEQLKLHREVRKVDEHGRQIKARISGPIIVPQPKELELEINPREGITSKTSYRSWLIDSALWDMTSSHAEGGAPAYMMIDARAFQLDDSSSTPFNLYWTLINRAYMGAYSSVPGERLESDGVFAPKLSTLYEWSGMERGYRKVKRIREQFVDAFERMFEAGLIEQWSCDDLTNDSTISFEELMTRRVEVRFPEAQLRHFPSLASGKDAEIEEL